MAAVGFMALSSFAFGQSGDAAGGVVKPIPGEELLSLGVGEQTTLDLDEEAERINVDPEGVVSLAMPETKRVRLTAEKPGYAVVLVQSKSGKLRRAIVHVKAADSGVIRRLASQLEGQLSSVNGLAVTTDGVTIALTGEIDDAGRALIRPYVAMLEGVVTDRTTPRRPPPPAPVATPMPTPPPIPQPDFSGRIVQIDVQIVQIEREKGKDLGIEWFADGGWRLSAQATGSYGIQADTGSASQGILTTPGTGGITPSGSGGVFDVFRGNGASGALVGSVNLSNVEWVINALVRDGHAKVLATPKLTVQSGKAADFLVGGELPIVQTNALSSIVEFKRFGTQLDIAPVVVAEDAVFIALRAAVSSVDNLQRVQGVPGLRTRETSTTVTVKDGRSFAIAGLLSTESFTDDTSVPVLSKIPLMGALFRNSRTIHKDLETIIIMTPHILRAGGRTEPPGARIAPGPEIRKAISLDTNMPLPEVVTGKDGP